jgi:predicted DNA-binding transcriptional regulator YafY
MSDVRVSDAVGVRPDDFRLEDYAVRSFGVFQEEQHDVVLRFAPQVVGEVSAFQFHPTQMLAQQPDGSIIIRFRAGGLREMAWHLFTWGETVTIVAPAELRRTMRELLAKASQQLPACAVRDSAASTDASAACARSQNQ